MINFLINKYNALVECSNLKKYSQNNKFLYLYYKVSWTLVRLIASILIWGRTFINIYPTRLTGEGEITVSLTSFPARIKYVWITIDSIMRQTVKPSSIHLYLTKEEFPDGFDSLPKRLKKYCNLGLKIFFEDNNLKPHNKYFYIFKSILLDKLQCDYVVTLDDDIYYNATTIEHLCNLRNKYPNCVCCNIARRILKDGKYSSWKMDVEGHVPSHYNLALGVGGVLYPVKLFKDHRLFDIDKIRDNCLHADDLWLKCFEILNEILVVTGEIYIPTMGIFGTQKKALSHTNVNNKKDRSENDIQWDKICKLYQIKNILK